MTNFSHARVITAKAEVTYGTSSAPTAALNAVVAYDLTVEPMAGSSLTRLYASDNLRKKPSIPYGTFVRATFGIDFIGHGGGLTTPPAWAALLLACGLQEFTSAGPDQTRYRPISSGYGSVTLGYTADDTYHLITGARGKLTFQAQRGQLPRINFEFWGIYTAPSTVARPNPVFTGWPDPKPVSAAATAFQLNAVDLALERCSCVLDNQLIYTDKPGRVGVDIVERNITGEVVFEAPVLADYNAFVATLGSTLQDLHVYHATNGAQMVSPRTQLERPAYTDIDGVRHISTPWRAAGWGATAGQQEFEFRYA